LQFFVADSIVRAAPPVLSLSATTLQPNTAGQTVQLFVNGTDTNIIADDVAIQVGDGGAANRGVSTGPTVSGLDLTTGTILAAGTNPLIFTDGPLVIEGDTIILSFQPVSDGGGNNPLLLATFKLSTVGFTGNSFPLSFENVDINHGGPFATDLVATTGKTISVTGPGTGSSDTVTMSIAQLPEPAGFGLVCLAGMLLKRRAVA
jgi:hypothetical protein